jgi:hypothetical protein
MPTATARRRSAVGADGNVVRVVSANKAATVTLRLQRGSPSAAAMQRAWKRATIKPLDQQPFRIRDIAAGVVHQSLIAWHRPGAGAVVLARCACRRVDHRMRCVRVGAAARSDRVMCRRRESRRTVAGAGMSCARFRWSLDAEPKILDLDGTKFVINHVARDAGPQDVQALGRLAGPLISEVLPLIEQIGSMDGKQALLEGKLNKLIDLVAGVDDAELLSLMMVLAKSMNGRRAQGVARRQASTSSSPDDCPRLTVWFIAAVKHNFAGFTLASLTQSA